MFPLWLQADDFLVDRAAQPVCDLVRDRLGWRPSAVALQLDMLALAFIVSYAGLVFLSAAASRIGPDLLAAIVILGCTVLRIVGQPRGTAAEGMIPAERVRGRVPRGVATAAILAIAIATVLGRTAVTDPKMVGLALSLLFSWAAGYTAACRNNPPRRRPAREPRLAWVWAK